jgi:Lon protease-like protein
MKLPDPREMTFPDDFAGRVRLFPLPNFVLFPGIAKGLHLFERRYCAMLEEAMASDRLIAMALLQPGWERDYPQCPAIHPTVCIGQVVQHAVTAGKTHNILLHGLRRAEVLEETITPQGFRNARVELIEDQLPANADRETRQRAALIAAMDAYLPGILGRDYQASFFPETLSLARLTDRLAEQLPLAMEHKQQLLAESNVERRCDWLKRFLDTFALIRTPSRIGSWPGLPLPFDPNSPGFSAN